MKISNVKCHQRNIISMIKIRVSNKSLIKSVFEDLYFSNFFLYHILNQMIYFIFIVYYVQQKFASLRSVDHPVRTQVSKLYPNERLGH